MEFQITFKTPGHYLSTTTLSSVTSDIRSLIEKSIIEGVNESEPKLSKGSIKNITKTQLKLYLSEVKKGSWEIELLSAVGFILAQLAIDILVNNDDYIKVRTYINKKLSMKIFESTKRNIEKRQKLASLVITDKKIDYSVTEKGIIKTTINLVLSIDQEKIEQVDLDSNNQIEKIIKDDMAKEQKRRNSK